MPNTLPRPQDLTLEAAVGQIICPTLFHSTYAFDEAARLAALERCGWGGYIVFHRDVETTRTRVETVQGASRIPLLIAADMEYGAGQQVAGLTAFPLVMAFGATEDPTLAYDLGAWTAIEAATVGVNWLLAPVADVTNNPLNPIISTRSFGGDPARVAAMVAAYVRGAQSQGALACAKHFPGHGDTDTDSHTRLGSVSADRARLDAVELPPFRAAIAENVVSIMTAHLALPALGVSGPATLSPVVMTDLLRRELGFPGRVDTDALVMGGITCTIDPIEAAVSAVAAGCDMLLMPPDPVATWEALIRAVEEGRLDRSRVLEACGRVLAAKARLGPPGDPPSRSPEALAIEVAGRALTLAKGPEGLQVPAGALAIALDDGVEPDRLEGWRQALATHALIDGGVATRETTDHAWERLLVQAEGAPMVVLGVFSPVRIHKDRSLLPARLVEKLEAIARHAPTVVVSFSSPFLVAQFPDAQAWVLTFGTRPYQVEAVVAALRAGGPYPGKLPVSMPTFLVAPPDSDEPMPTPRGPSFS
jgi:beta-glucosidase-like glycosyl hydrolase